MAISDLHGPANMQGVGNFYRAAFFVSLILLVLLPLAILKSDIWLEYRQKHLDGNTAALEEELTMLGRAVAVDSNEVAALDAQVIEIARSEQIFTEGNEPRSLWRPDSRWSEMGKAHILALWDRQAALRDRLGQSHALIREKTADLVRLCARRDENTYLRECIKAHRFLLYCVLLVGVFGVALSTLLWGGLVQVRVNAVLMRWASRS